MDEMKGSLLKFPTEKGKSYLLVSPLCWTQDDEAASSMAKSILKQEPATGRFPQKAQGALTGSDFQ